MSLHVAENHCGGFYFVSADEVDEVEEYCETCSDHDIYILASSKILKKLESVSDTTHLACMTRNI